MLLKKNSSIFYNFLLYFVISVFIICYSPSFFSTLENDSLSYINKESIRLSLYPLIIDSVNKNYNYLVIFQILFLASSLSFLAFSLKILKFSDIKVLIFLIIISLNIYYTSFSKTILTEAIYFSFINFSMSLFFIRKQIKESTIVIFFWGIVIGGVMAVKPEGLILSFTLLLLYILKQKKLKFRILFIIGFFTLPITENIFFYKFNENRSSVLDKSIVGKIFILSAYSKENQNNNLERDNYLEIFSAKSNLIRTYLKNMTNPFLKYNLLSDYEVVGQYQIDQILEDKKDILIKIENREFDILKDLILKNPISFLSLSTSNYMAMWMPGGKHIFFEQYKKDNPNPPYMNLLKKSSGDIINVDKKLLLIVMIFFFILFLVYICLTLISLYELLIQKSKKNFDLNIITLLINFHLLVISIINIGSPRYLMPFFPIIVLIILIRLNRRILKI